MIDISVVVPVYGCEMCLHELVRRLMKVLGSLELKYEIVLVEDRGTDNSWSVASEMARALPVVRAIRLSRNFGQHSAITAGLSISRGNHVVVMDCDLQDPPEEIVNLLATARKGFDVVLAKRRSKQHSAFRRMSARIYFVVLNYLSNMQVNGEFGTFSLLSRKVVNAYLKVPDQNRHYLFILHWLGFKRSFIEYDQMGRFSGKSSYTLATLVRHAAHGLFFQTTVLLKAIVFAGFFLSGLGLLMAIFFVYRYLVGPVAPGWTSLIVLLFIIGGFIILSTGITGLYIGKIFEQVKGRPLFVIDEVIEHHGPSAESSPLPWS